MTKLSLRSNLNPPGTTWDIFLLYYHLLVRRRGSHPPHYQLLSEVNWRSIFHGMHFSWDQFHPVWIQWGLYLGDRIARVNCQSKLPESGCPLPALLENIWVHLPLFPISWSFHFFHLFLSGGLSMSFSPDGAFPHPSVGTMSCLFFYTKHKEFSWRLINHIEFSEWCVPSYFYSIIQ